jgi:hypothetical protein
MDEVREFWLNQQVIEIVAKNYSVELYSFIFMKIQ